MGTLDNRSLPPEQLHHVQLEFLQIERLGNEHVGTARNALQLCRLVIFCRQHDDGRVCCRMVMPQPPAQFCPIHAGHHLVGDDDVGDCRRHVFHRFLTAVSHHRPVVLVQGRLQEVHHVMVVIHDKHRRPSVRIAGTTSVARQSVPGLADRNREGHPQPAGILGGDCPSMEFHIFPRHGQPQPRTVMLAVAFVVLIEDPAEFACRDTRPVVSNTDRYAALSRTDADRNPPSPVVNIFCSIGQEIADDRLYLDDVNIHPERLYGAVERKRHLPVPCPVRKLTDTVAHQGDEIDVRVENPVIALDFHPLEVQYAVDDVAQPHGIAMYRPQLPAETGIGRFRQQLLQRGYDQAERCLDLMRHLDEEVHLLFRQGEGVLPFAFS